MAAILAQEARRLILHRLLAPLLLGELRKLHTYLEM